MVRYACFDAVDRREQQSRQPENGESAVAARMAGQIEAPRLPSNATARQESVAQLTEFAREATHHAKGRQADAANEDPMRALNAEVPESEKYVGKNGAPPFAKDVIIGAIGAIKPAAKECYDTLLDDFPDATGTVRLTFVFETEDGMSRVQMSEIADNTTLFDQELHDCLSEAVSTIELPRPPHDNRMTVTYPFVFRSDDSN